MRLIDLEPRWVGLNGSMWNLPGTLHLGISFLCPHCLEQRLAVMFKPFIDPENLADKVPWAIPGYPNPNTGNVEEVTWWNRVGDTFETISFTPSIDASSSGHWHGYITNGNIDGGINER